MKKISMVVLALGTGITGSTAFAAEEYVMTCDEVRTQLNREATPEAREKLAGLEGACLGVVDHDGSLFMHTTVVVRRASSSTVTLYVPANDNTITVHPEPHTRVTVEGRKLHPRDLTRGQELDIYVPVDRFTQEIPPVVLMGVESGDDLESVPATSAQALPTTG